MLPVIRHKILLRVLTVHILLLALIASLPQTVMASKEHDEVIQQKVKIFINRVKCLDIIANVTVPQDGGLYCEPVWDNLTCWPHYVKAGENETQPCPTYIQGFNPSEKAIRSCTEDGTWQEHPSANVNTTWTDFTDCMKKPGSDVPAIIEENMPIIIQISTVGYSISLGTLIVATTIMIVLKKLHCQRNTIHINLFISFIVRAVVSLLRNTLLVKHLALPSDIKYAADGTLLFIHEGTHWECKLLNTLWQYSLNANYMWIFVEGLYLHTLIFFAVFSQSRKFFKLYILIGWVFPLIFIIIWVVVRISKNNTLCWNTHHMGYYWILNAPIVSSISVNFFFFLNIIRVLFTKIRDCNTRDPRRYRKLAKSTLVLIPLFGVYYIFFIVLSAYKEPKIAVVHIYIEMTLNSFQGTVVAFLFCFLNGEVRAEIMKKWHRHWLRRQSVLSGRSSLALSTTSYLMGRDRTSLSVGMPICDIMSREDKGMNRSQSSFNNNNGGMFHKVSSMPKLSLNSSNSTLVTIPRVSSASKVTFSRVDSIIEENQEFPVYFSEEESHKNQKQNACNGNLKATKDDETKLLLSGYLKANNKVNDDVIKDVPKASFKGLNIWDNRYPSGQGVGFKDQGRANISHAHTTNGLSSLSVVEEDGSDSVGSAI